MADKRISEEKLLQFLRTYGDNTSIALNDLRSPKTPMILAVLTNFLKALELNMDYVNTPPLSAYENLESSEYFEDVLPLATFKKLMEFDIYHIIMPQNDLVVQRFVPENNSIVHSKLRSETVHFSGITDIGILDFMEPKPKRTKKILNYLIILWRFVGMKACIYNEIEEKQQAEIERKHLLLTECEECEQQIEEELHFIQKMKEAANADLEKNERFNELTEKKSVITEKHQVLKAEKADLLQRQGNFDVKITTLKEKLEEYNKIIIRSPQRLNEELEHIKLKLMESHEKAKEAHSKMEEKKKQYDSLQEQHEKSTRAIELLKKCTEDKDQLQKASVLAEHEQTDLKNFGEKVIRQHLDLDKEEEERYLKEQLRAKGQLNDQKRIDALKEIIAMNEQDLEKMIPVLDGLKRTNIKLKEDLEESKQILVDTKQMNENHREKEQKNCAYLLEMINKFFHKVEEEIDESQEISYNLILEEESKKALL